PESSNSSWHFRGRRPRSSHSAVCVRTLGGGSNASDRSLPSLDGHPGYATGASAVVSISDEGRPIRVMRGEMGDGKDVHVRRIHSHPQRGGRGMVGGQKSTRLYIRVAE